MNLIETAIAMLGAQAQDRVTGITGMVASVNFDAYGCVQLWITPQAQDGKLVDSVWFDVKRVKLTGERIMPTPEFAQTKFGEENGGNALSAPSSGPSAPSAV